MSRNGISLGQHLGNATIAVSRIFYNSRDRQKYRGKKGTLVADMCECVRDTGRVDDAGNAILEPVAVFYLQDGKTCGGIRTGGFACEEPNIDICSLMLENFPVSSESIRGVTLPSTLCEALTQFPVNPASVLSNS
jgi:hypothetical protein